MSGVEDLALTLDALAKFERRFVVLTSAQADAVALWIFHTHAFAAADITAYLSVSSAEKRSGKTRFLEVVELLVRCALAAVNVSTAALFRVIEERAPTLLLDEVDAIFAPKSDREELRGILNAGYRRGAVVYRMGGAKNSTLEGFGVFCPKVFAGIGNLPDTIRDRSIVLRLERRTKDEEIERFRRRDVEGDAEPLRQSCESLAEHHSQTLAYARPSLPDELDDRAQDVWEPLLAIADLAGYGWPERARTAALALSTGESREEESRGATLLKDIFNIFENGSELVYPTADLITALARIEESPWGDWYGKQITPQKLGQLLKPYRIKTMSVWADGQTHRGYKAEQFTDAWLRVLGVRSVRSVRSEATTHTAANGPNTPNALDATVGANGHDVPLIGVSLP